MRSFVLSLGGILLILSNLSDPSTARAQSNKSGCGFESSIDQRGNGLFGGAVFHCDLIGQGNSNDLVTIITRGSVGQVEQEWKKIDNLFSDHVWFFDYRGDGWVELVIDFYSDEAGTHADFFETRELTTWVEKKSLAERQAALKLMKPTLKILAPDGWWIKNGFFNFNIDIDVDGFVDAVPFINAYSVSKITNDGIVDFIIHIRDMDHDGRPDYDLRTLGFVAPNNAASSFLMVNAKDDEAPIIPALPWPYIGPVSYGFMISSPHNETPPPIQVDWEEGKIRAVGEFVSSRGNDSQWFVYSFEPIEFGGINRPNFESPFGWYDLAEDSDRNPELSVRLLYYDPGDPAYNLPRPLNFVRYSWDQNNDNLYDYKLGMLGQNLVDSEVALQSTQFRLIPYHELPSWVIGNTWDIVTFVAAEGARKGGEGIYLWDPLDSLANFYYAGITDMPPMDPETDFGGFGIVDTGYRVEYQYDYGDLVKLYISPIDGKLHLAGSEKSIWNIDDQSRLLMADIDEDGFFDEWTYLEKQETSQAFTVTERLNKTPSYLFFSKNDNITIQPLAVAVKPDVDNILPPKDFNSWEALGVQLAPYDAQRRDPANLKSWLNAFDNKSSSISGAYLTNLRFMDGGFRFKLSLGINYQLIGSDLLGIAGMPPGEYLVENDVKTFKIIPFPPIQLNLDVTRPGGIGDAASVWITLNNRGLADATDLTLVMEMIGKPAGPIELNRQQINVMAEQTNRMVMKIPPTVEKGMALRFRLEDNQGENLAEAILPNSSMNNLTLAQRIMEMSTPGGRWLSWLVFLALFAAVPLLALRKCGSTISTEDSE